MALVPVPSTSPCTAEFPARVETFAVATSTLRITLLPPSTTYMYELEGSSVIPTGPENIALVPTASA